MENMDWGTDRQGNYYNLHPKKQKNNNTTLIVDKLYQRNSCITLTIWPGSVEAVF